MLTENSRIQPPCTAGDLVTGDFAFDIVSPLVFLDEAGHFPQNRDS
jgi:hypothetical protein